MRDRELVMEAKTRRSTIVAVVRQHQAIALLIDECPNLAKVYVQVLQKLNWWRRTLCNGLTRHTAASFYTKNPFKNIKEVRQRQIPINLWDRMNTMGIVQ